MEIQRNTKQHRDYILKVQHEAIKIIFNNFNSPKKENAQKHTLILDLPHGTAIFPYGTCE